MAPERAVEGDVAFARIAQRHAASIRERQDDPCAAVPAVHQVNRELDGRYLRHGDAPRPERVLDHDLVRRQPDAPPPPEPARTQR